MGTGKRIRINPSLAVAVVALVFAAASGAAATTFVVSSNRQVGPRTIAGHHPPHGKHANVIAHSINGTDIAPNSIGEAQVDENALSGLQLGTGSNVIAHKLISCSAGGTIAVVDVPLPGVTLKALCQVFGDGKARAQFLVFNNTNVTLHVDDSSTVLSAGQVATSTHLLAYDLDSGNDNILFATDGNLLETTLIAERYPTSDTHLRLIHLTGGIIVNQNARQARFWVEASGY